MTRRESPILFSAPMVRALLDGRKTQTRRAVKGKAAEALAVAYSPTFCGARVLNYSCEEVIARCPYGAPGDRLWVRETFRLPAEYDDVKPTLVRGDAPVWFEATTDQQRPEGWGKTRPAIHMPRWVSRLTLEITEVRCERLHDISEADARAEGAAFHDGRGIGHSGWRHDLKDVHVDARSSFARLWGEINGPGSWSANPWVWAVSFKTVSADERRDDKREVA